MKTVVTLSAFYLWLVAGVLLGMGIWKLIGGDVTLGLSSLLLAWAH